MSRDNLERLLESMLEDSAAHMQTEEQREQNESERRAMELRERGGGAETGPATIDDAALLTGLTDPDLRRILAKAAPDDLLVVLATGDDTLQRRILRNLDEDSVRWLQENLRMMDRITNAEREASQRKVLKVANALLAEGSIELPEPESVGTDQGPDPEDKSLKDLLTDLVRIAKQSGPSALEQVLESGDQPLLSTGAALVEEGKSGQELRAALESERAKLEADYARRLRWMEEALVAIAAGEDSDTFRERLTGDS